MVRVLHMIGSLELGGSQSMIMNIYRKIDREKLQFDFIVDHPDRMYFADEIHKLGGKIFIMPTFVGSNVLEIRKKWKEFFLDHQEYKILHSHVRSYASFYLPIAKEFGITTIIHSHSTSNGRGATALIKNILQIPLRFQADYFMACSKCAGQWLFGKRIVRQKNFFIIRNAIDLEQFAYNEDVRTKTRKELGIEKKFVLGFLGRVTASKNPWFVLDVFNEIKQRKKNVKLLFVGDGELLQEIKENAKDKGLAKDIIFTGTKGNTFELYAAMDAYCFPSLWEGLGISLIEAQASGLYCVCSENIPDEAIVTDLVEKVKLDKGAAIWAQKILQHQKYNRKCTSDLIRKAGYDIRENARWIQKFYLKIGKSI